MAKHGANCFRKSCINKFHFVFIYNAMCSLLGTYEHIRRSGFFNKYTGFNLDVIKHFIADIKLDEMKDFEKNVSILFDEMKIKSGLVFSRSSGKLIGFTELGYLNEELYKFERRIDEERTEKELATHVLSFMVRGLFKRFNYPIGYFVSCSFDSDQLYPCVWEAVRVVELLV